VEPLSSPRSTTAQLSQAPPEHVDIDRGACEETRAEGQFSEHTQGETHVPTLAEDPNLEVLGSTAAAVGTESNILSFRWAMGGRVYTKHGMAITMMWRELQLLYDCGTPPYKGQDEIPTQSSQAAASAPEVAIQWDVHKRIGGEPLFDSRVPPMFVFLIVLIILHMYLGKYLYMESIFLFSYYTASDE
jgi:hypothetical protein